MSGAAARCICRSEKCAHANGKSCGKPVENPVGETGPVVDSPDQMNPTQGPWVKAGYCEECWKRNPPATLLKIWTDRLFQYFEEGK
jgi:hypothetical protein